MKYNSSSILEASSIATLTDYMFLKDNVLDADVTIVLGQTRWERPLERALELYSQGLAGTVVLTGGFNPRLGTTEAQKMQEAWLSMGHGKESLIIESRASNTMENMVYSHKLLKDNGVLRNCKKVNVVSINYHMRRSVETFRHVFSDIEIELGVVNYPSIYCSPESWHLNPRGRELIITEYDKIQSYLARRG